jgi:hypothetical protein
MQQDALKSRKSRNLPTVVIPVFSMDFSLPKPIPAQKYL